MGMIPSHEGDQQTVGTPTRLRIKIVTRGQDLRPETPFGVHDGDAVLLVLVVMNVEQPLAIR